MLRDITKHEVCKLEEPLSRAVMSLSAIVQIMDDSTGQGHIKNHELSMLLDTAVLTNLLFVEKMLFNPEIPE